MQKAGLPSFISKKIVDGDIITQEKTEHLSKLFKKDDSTGCKLIVPINAGNLIRDRIINQNTAALEHYIEVVHDVNKEFNTEKNTKKNEREVNPKKINSVGESREKKLETGKKKFLADIKKSISLVDLRINGKIQLKKSRIGKLNQENRETTESVCKLTEINPYERKIYYRVEGAEKGELINSISTMYLCFDDTITIKSNSPKHSSEKSDSHVRTKTQPVTTHNSEVVEKTEGKLKSPRKQSLKFKKNDSGSQ